MSLENDKPAPASRLSWLRWPVRSPRLAEAGFTVVDTETSGLDTRRDRLLSIGACRVSHARLDLGTSFYCELRQDQVSDADNILVHGLGQQAQLGGQSPGDALEAFTSFAGTDTLVAFNAPFDQAFLRSAFRQHLGQRFSPRWIDLAVLGGALFPQESARRRTLDDWLERFGIATPARHNALGDAACTAELLLVMLQQASREGIHDVRGLRRAQRHRRWISG